MPMRVGIDLVAVASVAQALADHGARYLERIYTPQEREDCRGASGVDVERLAGRFAVKEAAIKVLRPDEDPLPWQSIAVAREPSGAPTLALSGRAAELAAQAGIVSLAISISHEGPYACAVVVAELAEPEPERGAAAQRRT